MPLPRPLYEIFVYSPRVEGVHLRFGKVARGGLRWSDRPQDFRTEVLGLVKAQQVKNAVIVPVGAKGGFVPKHLPPASDRQAWLAEGTESYKIFVRTLLQLTDNIVGDGVVPPADTVRHDGDDPYLVVAADKGTATFSDIANALSIEKGHWLGDAFASGGSQGYDHKKMGITARGAWEAVKRHFREIDIDIQTTPVTVAGVGDMSGDVFGNGMLLSRALKLVAAFDHRDIFLDPNPDPEASFLERERLFALPRSSWQDYDKSLISAGGGVFPRNAKSIPLSDEIRALLDLDKPQATPAEVMNAILKARVDLLWFGGIGTYIRAASETDEQVGDRANDAIRISGPDVRAKVIGEGANLGVTQRGRIEAAQKGVRLNTDAIDNSAGVNTSDVEVNIKIALTTPGARRTPHARPAQRASRGHDGGRRGARPAQQLPADARALAVRAAGPRRSRLRAPADAHARGARPPQPRGGVSARRQHARRARPPRRGADAARARGAAGLRQALPARRAAREPGAGRSLSRQGARALFPRRDARALPRCDRLATACAARSSRRSSPTRSSTAAARPWWPASSTRPARMRRPSRRPMRRPAIPSGSPR